MYDYDDYDDEGRGPWRTALLVVGSVVAASVIGFLGWRALSGDDDGSTLAVPASTTTTELDATQESTTIAPDTTVEATSATSEVATSTLETTTTAASVESTTTAAPTTTPAVTSTTAAPASTAPASAPTTAKPQASTTAPSPPTTKKPNRPSTTQPSETPPYDTLPDGSPVPAVAVFGKDQITLTGAVPSNKAKTLLQTLAVANAKPGQASNIANFLTVNPAVPTGVGVRVVELTSTRFPTASAEVLPPHALELDRVVSIMNALPHVSVLVIGHSDQRGDTDRNFELSAERAEAVVDYLVAQGISPDRLSSRAVGEKDLLTLNDDAAALELNRRTEFVFIGLLSQ